MIDKTAFQNPPRKFRVNPMVHEWIEDHRLQMEAIRDYGFGGVVTNVPRADGFTSNKSNLERFDAILRDLDAAGLSYWIYDEAGYPSGRGGGLTLEGHPELAAKGFYAHRRMAYVPEHAHFRLDDQSDRIVWAAKYPVETPGLHESFVRYDCMTAVPFTDTEVECDLGEKEILYVFCTKDAHEGSHATHNVSSFLKNINIMDKRAVRRFIDCCFEPIAARIPDAYARAEGVFTDEPSLHVTYVREYEVWPHALAPWVDGLFEAYEAEYGESLLPKLPLIFEGRTEAYPVRVRFYELVGKLIAEAWTAQLSDWCESHGGAFSGHYLLEERMNQHVKQYGNYIRVLAAASYPGIDVLPCYPEGFKYTTTKFAQMAVRKKNSNGMMVEICPFDNVEAFKKAPLDNMSCVMGLLYLGGVRNTHSYFAADYTGWREGRIQISGYTDQAQSNWFNEYVGRMGLVLDGLQNRCGTFIYFPMEDAQAKHRPCHEGGFRTGDNTTDEAVNALADAVYDAGRDFYYIDLADLREARSTLRETGVASISGNPVEQIFVPSVFVMYREAMEILAGLADAGVTVRYVGKGPRYAAEDGERLCLQAEFAGVEEIASLVSGDADFPEPSVGGTVLRGRFVREDTVIRMLVNKERHAVTLRYCGPDGEIWNPSDGSVTPVMSGTEITVPALRSIFVVSK